MRFLRNIQPLTPLEMTAVVQHGGPQIASKALVNDGQKEIRFFSYAQGEDIDRETYAMDTLLMVLTGRFKVVFGEDGEAVVSPGEMFALEAGTEYGIEALEEGKLISILIGG